ncbi:MAG: PilZ domain-containing protein [Archangiaceae bacterium]|nr:PilZ domain-containing protein [Archangiaceae bacterium]
MLELKLQVAFPADLIARFYPNGKLGGLTLEGRAPGAVGDLVTLLVQVQRPRRDFQLKGQLAWARLSGNRNLRESFGVDFLGDHEAERLMQFARAELAPSALRNAPRQATDLPVRIIHGGRTRKELLVDLSDGGAFVRSPDPIPVGEAVEMRVTPPRAFLSFTLKGRVAWQRNAGPAQGFGVEFSDDDPAALLKLYKLLARLSTS